jgi:carbamate kinase
VLVVAALGGNALLRRGEPLGADVQRANARVAARALAELVADHRLVVTHGNGPQVGLLALQNESNAGSAAYPLDVLGAETEGMIGYVLEQELGNALHDPGRVATVLTQVVVDADDPAFAAPTKPIGPVYDEATARELAAGRRWSVAPDGDAWRRVVASPVPHRVVEERAIRLLVDAGIVVICVGGGGIPVVVDAGGLRGVEAVVDKDAAAALFAARIGADALLLLTDVSAVCLDWGTPTEMPIRHTTVTELRAHQFAEGSMAPKVRAACDFVERTGGIAGIGALIDASAILRGDAGTYVTADGERG